MTKIKCRYWICLCCNVPVAAERCPYWPDQEECKEYKSVVKKHDKDGNLLLSDQCEDAVMVRGEFEKNASSYELDEDELIMKGRKIDVDDIEYLEIDGRVIIDEFAEESTK